MAQKQKGGGAKKIGRTASKCKMYKDRGVRLKNKGRKLKRHMEAQPNDKCAARAFRNMYRDRGDRMVEVQEIPKVVEV